MIGSIQRVDTRAEVAALTFDDGPHQEHTPAVLDILAVHGARATFFVTGVSAERHPRLLERIISEGHTIGNHTWSHPSLPGISRARRIREILAVPSALGNACAPLFRPPWGHQSLATRLDCFLLAQTVIGWSVDVRDWTLPPAARMARHLAERTERGSIVLLHDALADRPDADLGVIVRALDLFLSDNPRGLRFVTIPELLRQGSPRKVNWFWRPDASTAIYPSV